MKTFKYTILAVFALMSNLISAQGEGHRAKVDEMHAHKWQYIVEKSNLTSEEQKIIQPVFMEYEKAVWKQHTKNREFFMSVRGRDKNIKPDYAKLNDHYAEIELINAQQFKTYHLKLRKLLPPETLFKYYRAEKEFKRKLLRDYQGHSNGGKRR